MKIVRKIIFYQILSLAIIVIGFQGTSYAALPFTSDDLMKIYQGQNFRDPNESLACAVAGGAQVDPGENAEAVWRFFADKLPAVHIAGILGNMHAESGVQPQRLQSTPSGTVTPAAQAILVSDQAAKAWGIVQWDPNSKVINNFPIQTDADVLINQLGFLWDQLEGTSATSKEKAAGDALKSVPYSSPEYIPLATETFARKYERPRGSNDSASPEHKAFFAASLVYRVAAAEAAYDRFASSIPTVDAPINAPEGVVQEIFDSCNISSSGSVIVDVAKAELAKGVMEWDANVLKYTDGQQWRWCASFVSWVFKEAGEPFSGGISGGWMRPGVSDMQAMFQNTGGLEYFAVGTKAPQLGDVAFYIGAQTPDSGSTSHVNIVIEVNEQEGTMVTIGGNESNRVKQSTRPIELGALSLVGFGRVL